MSGGPTYPEVGATRGELPSGYHHVRAARVIGTGPEVFQAAAEALLRFEAQRRAGVRVNASASRAALGTTVTLSLGVGPLRLSAPCEVVYVVEEPRRRGFAYGTLPGHPESGEERFLVEHRPDDVVTFEIVAFSRPATWWSRLGGPVSRGVQAWVTRRYLRALDAPRGPLRA